MGTQRSCRGGEFNRSYIPRLQVEEEQEGEAEGRIEAKQQPRAGWRLGTQEGRGAGVYSFRFRFRVA